MKTALHFETVVHVPSANRAEWQRLYMACLRQELTCLHCGDPVKMQLSIEQPPFFYHPFTAIECENKDRELNSGKQVSSSSVSVNGFQLPQRRSIHSKKTGRQNGRNRSPYPPSRRFALPPHLILKEIPAT